jgi:gluconolactonase
MGAGLGWSSLRAMARQGCRAVWTSSQDGVQCYAPDGTLLGRIRIPTMVSNLTFGGPKRNRLFITATNALYSVFVASTGAQTP